MRRTQNNDDGTIQLLKEGAEAAAGKQDTDKKFQQLQEQIRMLQYALGNVFKTLQSYPAVKDQIDQLDYRTLGVARAIAEVTGRADFDQLVEKHAQQAKVDSFNELSNADDQQRGLTVDDAAECSTDHYLILTSECKEFPDQGIFRSKMDVGGEEFAALKDSFVGKKVGETVEAKIMGKDHLVTILGLRKKPVGEKSDASSQS